MTKEQAYVLAIDQGTTGSRAFLFADDGRVVASAYQEFPQHFPQPAWVEHDPLEIWSSVQSVVNQTLSDAQIDPHDVCSIGITNQRETALAWDRQTGQPLGRAIVWQCRRTEDLCRSDALKVHRADIQQRTGLILDPYFSATKWAWMKQHWSQVKDTPADRLCLGTIDSWLIWKMTAGTSFVTDMTNASRTLLFNIDQKQWDNQLLSLFNIDRQSLPNVLSSGAEFGLTADCHWGLPVGVPIRAVLGDQQAALYGQGCYDPGMSKNTYGTGCFLVMNTGDKRYDSDQGLLTTLAVDRQGQPVYALEGSIFIAGAVVQWLRDQMGLIKESQQSEQRACQVNDNGGVYFVPAFTGLGAPYWRSDVRGLITGLTRGVTSDHMIRAALESIAYQTRDVFVMMQQTFKEDLTRLYVDGGACYNDFLMQFQADILNVEVHRPAFIDSTVLGVALLAGRGMGLWQDTADLRALPGQAKTFQPQMQDQHRQALYQGWQAAIHQACAKK